MTTIILISILNCYRLKHWLVFLKKFNITKNCIFTILVNTEIMDNKLNTVLAGIYLSNSAVQQAFHDKRLDDSSFIYVMSGWPKEC